MPTTPGGTAYTVLSTTLVIAGQVDEVINMCVPNALIGTNAKVPVLQYAHGYTGGPTQFSSSSGASPLGGLRNRLLDVGWVTIEGTGGGTDSFGSPVARRAYTEQIAYLETLFEIELLVNYGGSMGGAVSYFMGALSRYAHLNRGVIIAGGVTNLRQIYDHQTSTTQKREFEVMFRALPSNPEDVYIQLAGYEPLDMPLHAWKNKALLTRYALADTTVPPDPGIIPWLDKYGDQLWHLEVQVGTGNHGDIYPSPQTAFDFCQLVRSTPPPPPPGGIVEYWSAVNSTGVAHLYEMLR